MECNPKGSSKAVKPSRELPSLSHLTSTSRGRVRSGRMEIIRCLRDCFDNPLRGDSHYGRGPSEQRRELP
ncbi:hypothetical protein WJX84_004173 [Apatococcus fuscideae]|uniref:Uncharacterized protein n=1 Tax=Apatococcus fuscideae TaxID=2026836 RepID=A0AAW1SPG8_9CHLO